MSVQTSTVQVFCCYASDDTSFFLQLKSHLAVLINEGQIVLWSQSEISPGTEWDLAIANFLEKADLILLLISPSFMNSAYCREKEMELAIKRYKTGDACVIPVLVKPTPFWETTFLGSLQVLPPRAKPITTWKSREQAFEKIVAKFGEVILQIQQNDKYPIQKYSLISKSFFSGEPYRRQTIFDSHSRDLGHTPRKESKQEAERLLKNISDKIGGMLEEVFQSENQQGWTIVLPQGDCSVKLTWKAQSKEVDMETVDYFWGGEILFTTSCFSLLDQFVKASQISNRKFPYHELHWLVPNFDLAQLVTRIYEQTGKEPLEPYGYDFGERFAAYLLLAEEYCSISTKISFKDTSSLVDIGVFINDKRGLDWGNRFYHAHELLSAKTVVSMLTGKYSHKQTCQILRATFGHN